MREHRTRDVRSAIGILAPALGRGEVVLHVDDHERIIAKPCGEILDVHECGPGHGCPSLETLESRGVFSDAHARDRSRVGQSLVICGGVVGREDGASCTAMIPAATMSAMPS